MTHESAKMGAGRGNVRRYPYIINGKRSAILNRTNETGRVDAAFHGASYTKVSDCTPTNMTKWSCVCVAAIVDVDVQRMSVATELTIIGFILRFAHHHGDGEVGSHDSMHR